MLFYSLLFTSLCERLSFAGIKSFIMIYLSYYLLVDNNSVYTINGSYIFISFFFCMIGSLITKNSLSNIETIILSLIIKFIGYCIIYFLPGFQNTLIGLSYIGIGGGILKISNTNLFLYTFTSATYLQYLIIFINLGLIISPIICGYAIEYSFDLPILILLCITLLNIILIIITYFYQKMTILSNTKIFSFFLFILLNTGYILSLFFNHKININKIIMLAILLNLSISFYYYSRQVNFMLILFFIVMIFQAHLESLQLFYIQSLNPYIFNIYIPIPILSFFTPITVILLLRYNNIWPNNYTIRILIIFFFLLISYIFLYYISFFTPFTLIAILPILLTPGACEAIAYIPILEKAKSQNKIFLGVVLNYTGIAYYISRILNINYIEITDFQILFLKQLYIIIAILIILLLIKLYFIYKNNTSCNQKNHIKY